MEELVSYDNNLLFFQQIIYPPPSAAGAVPLMGPLTPDPTAYIAGAGAAPAALARTSAAASAAAAAVAAAQQQMRTVRMWVPNNMVGALIGAKVSVVALNFIRNIYMIIHSVSCWLLCSTKQRPMILTLSCFYAKMA